MKRLIVEALTIIILLGAVVGWAEANHIHNPNEFISYFRAESNKVKNCVGNGKHPYATCIKGEPGLLSGPVSPAQLKASTTALSSTPTITLDTKAPYVPSEWQHWLGSPCDVSVQVMEAQGKGVETSKANKCEVVSGTWTSPYDDAKVTDVNDLTVDNVVPIQYALEAGGANWPTAQKEKFANDVSNLAAVSTPSQQQKGSKFPSAWLPTSNYQCQYARIWVNTLKKYSLGVDASDRSALNQALNTCKG